MSKLPIKKEQGKVKTIYHLDWIYQQINSMIDLMDEKAIAELTSGTEKDLGNILSVIEQEAINIFNFAPEPFTKDKVYELDNLASNIDESLKILNYNYFKLTMLPDFFLAKHSIEWGNYIQMYQRVCLLASRSLGKCFSPDTEVLMFDGRIKKIKDIKVGDEVMGPDNQTRKVLSLHKGFDEMYEIEQKRSENYVVNSQHLLHFKKGVWDNKKRTYLKNDTQIVEMPTEEFHTKSEDWKSKSWGYRVNGGWELETKKQKIEPYFMGLWLGDGHSNDHTITNQDKEVKEYLSEYAGRLGIGFREAVSGNKFSNKITNGVSGQGNYLLSTLKEYNLIFNKHIPDNYLYANKEQRLQLLAGLIDSDGYYQVKGNMYHIGMKTENLVKQIQQLCWSLGFRATYKVCNKKLSYANNRIYTSYQVSISGDIYIVPVKIKYKKAVNAYTKLQDHYKSSLRTKKLGIGEYVGFSCDKDRLFLLKDGTVVHNSYELSFAYPIWQMYGYRRGTEMNPIDRRTELKKNGVIMTNKFSLGKDLLKIITDEIRMNELLWDRLKPDGYGLGREEIECKNGSGVKLRSYDASVRGLHPGWIGVDDFLGKESMYSKDQRDKSIDVFKSEIMNAIEPDGQIVVAGTPFHIDDLYSYIRSDNTWKLFEYPAIFPNGELAAPHRYSFNLIQEKRKSLGSLIFSREIMVVPVSDISSIFPWSILENSFKGMENFSLVNNIHSHPKKFVRVTVGCDFAISGNIGADASVFSVWGLDQFNDYWLLHIWRGQGKSHNEQISKIAQIERDFNPNAIIMETNGFQLVMAKMAQERNVRNIIEFNTTGFNKKDVYDGLPSLAVLFEQGRIKMPRGDEYSREQTDWLLGEFNSITIKDNGKLESASEHDDGPMSSFFGIKGDQKQKSNLIFELV